MDGGPGWWAPRRIAWWTGALFAVGSACFLVAPLPGYLELVGSGVDGVTFFVGSLFFTSAATLQWLQSMRDPVARRTHPWRPASADWWSGGIQWVGTLFFNVTTYEAMTAGLDAAGYDVLVWTPDARGSVCFLVSGAIAYLAVSRGIRPPSPRTRDWWIAGINLLGCIAFGIAALASYWIPTEGSVVDLAASNLFTSLGGLCFLVGSLLLLPRAPDAPAA